MVLALGHFGVQFMLMKSGLLLTCLGLSPGDCGVQFRLTGNGSPQDPCVFGFGALWGSVQADGIWSPQDLLEFDLWDIVGFSSG